MDGGAWWAAVHGVAGSRTWLSDFTFTFHFHALEKEVATHSRVLAWKIPGTGEPGRLPSIGSHRVGHDWCDLAAAAAAEVNVTVIVLISPLWTCNSSPTQQGVISYNPLQVLQLCHMVGQKLTLFTSAPLHKWQSLTRRAEVLEPNSELCPKCLGQLQHPVWYDVVPKSIWKLSTPGSALPNLTCILPLVVKLILSFTVQRRLYCYWLSHCVSD